MHNVRLLVCSILVCFSSSLLAQQRVGVRSGPMVGYGEMTETMLWVQTISPATVQYRYWLEGKKGDTQLSKKILTLEENDYIAKVVLSDLKPASRYEYELLLNGKVFTRPYRLTFTTQTLWQWRTDPPAFAVAFGSCAYINDSTADRPGRKYGDSYNVFTSIATKNPDAMLWIGDNWYYRDLDQYAESKMRARVTRDRTLPEMQSLLGSTHNYAIWDDHDFGPNNSDRTYKLRTEALNIFRLYWANQTYGTVETHGVFFRFLWGDAEFFMLDGRFHRSPNAMPDDAAKTMYGKEQLAWLKESLVSSDATFKIIVSGNQFLVKHKDETLRNYPQEYDELTNWIKSRNISGIVFLSGDKHHADLSCLRNSSFYSFYEFTSSPLTAGLASHFKPEDNVLSVPGTFVNEMRNFGILKFDGPKNDRRLTMECYDNNGKLRWSHVVKASELKPPVQR